MTGYEPETYMERSSLITDRRPHPPMAIARDVTTEQWIIYTPCPIARIQKTEYIYMETAMNRFTSL